MIQLKYCPFCQKTTAHAQVGYNALTKEGTYKCGICQKNHNEVVYNTVPFRMKPYGK